MFSVGWGCRGTCRRSDRGTTDAQSHGVRRMRQLALVTPMLVCTTGCASLSRHVGLTAGAAASSDDSLTRVVAELKLHLRDDTYRYDRATTDDGRDVYAVALWKLDRIAALRARPQDKWENADFVIEFARGKALEKLRRYGEAAAAFERVAGSGSLLGDSAAERAHAVETFAAASARPTEPFVSPEEERVFIEGRIARWRELAEATEGTPQQSLALEEVEAWQVMRVDWYARGDRLADAIGACENLLEGNRQSKLFGKHLLRLGDLYAASARRAELQSRANLQNLDPSHYESLVDQAFSAYELAAEDRRPTLRREARSRIDALLAYQEGAAARVP
jgi:tetratricopeptide (TPR) repeat protein